MEKKKESHYDLFYLFDLQYGRMSDTDRRSAASDGIHAWRSVFLEPEAVSYTDL